MARLRNRQVKADFWNDPELLRWPRDKRFTYQGLWAIAEDSGCIEDDPFGWKVILWPSPADADITVEVLEKYRDEFIAAHKAIAYEADGKRYLYLRTFHQHELPRNPQSPNLPLPIWLKWVPDKDSKERSRGHYDIDDATLLSQYCDVNVSPVLSCPVLSSPVLKREARKPSAPASSLNGSAKWVGLWVDACTDAGLGEPTKSDKAVFGAKVKSIQLLDDQIMHDTILRMVELGKPPGTAALVYGDVKRMGEDEIARSRTEVRRVR